MNTELVEMPREINLDDRDLLKSASGILVKSESDLLVAGELRKKIYDRHKSEKKGLDLICDGFYRAHKRATAKRSQLLTPYTDAMKSIDRQIDAYEAERERMRKEEEARLAELARKQEEEARLQEAEEAENRGDREEAEAILDSPLDIPVPIQPQGPVKISGLSRSKKFDFRIINPSRIDRRYLIPNEKAIRALVTQLGKEAENVIGKGSIMVYERTVTRSTGR